LSTSVPFTSATWYDSSCSGTTCNTGDFLEVRLQLFQQRIVGRDPGGSVPAVAR
jgi:hypothetical protein